MPMIGFSAALAQAPMKMKNVVEDFALIEGEGELYWVICPFCNAIEAGLQL